MQETESFANSVVLMMFCAVVFMGLTIRQIEIRPESQQNVSEIKVLADHQRWETRKRDIEHDKARADSRIIKLKNRLPITEHHELLSLEEFQFRAFSVLPDLQFAETTRLEPIAPYAPDQTKNMVIANGGIYRPKDNRTAVDLANCHPQGIQNFIEFDGTLLVTRFVYFSTMKGVHLSLWVIYNRETEQVLGFSFQNYPEREHEDRIAVEEF